MSEEFFRDHTQTERGRSKLTRVLAALGTMLFCGISQVATAVPLPVTYSGFLSFNQFPPNPLNVQGVGDVDQLFGPGGRLRLESGLTPSPFVLASVPDIRDNFFGRVIGNLTYEFEIIGSAGPTEIVSIRAAATGEVKGSSANDPFSGGGYALKARWSLENANTGAVLFSEGIETPQMRGLFYDSFDHIIPFDLSTNQRYRVNLFADVAIANGTTNGASGSAHAYIDPVFSFAPGFESGYSFVFSDGVGNIDASPTPDPVPIPEPSSLALLFAGLLPLRMLRKRLVVSSDEAKLHRWTTKGENTSPLWKPHIGVATPRGDGLRLQPSPRAGENPE